MPFLHFSPSPPTPTKIFAADHSHCVHVTFVLPGMKVLYNQGVNMIRHCREIARNVPSWQPVSAVHFHR